MDRVNRLAVVILGMALLACAVPLGDALAQESDSVEIKLTPSSDSGVSGTATLTDVEKGVMVELSMQGLPEAGVKHINHIHGGGTCAEDRAGVTAPVTIPLTPITASADGTGSVDTTLDNVTVDGLFDPDEERYILLHSKAEKGEGVPPGITCADLVMPVQSDNQGIEGSNLPQSGGPNPRTLLHVGVILALAAVAVSVRRVTRP